MAKIPQEMIAKWANKVDEWFENTQVSTLHASDITSGREVWAIAGKLGLTREAYNIGRDVLDAHIQTALEKIFPNAIFLDPKRY